MDTSNDEMKVDAKVLYEYDLANRCPLECAARIKQLCEERLKDRLANLSDTTNNENTQQTLQTFLDMRDTNRFYQFQAENSKLDVEKERQKFDNLNLLFQNYLYEKNHLLKEIHSLSEFNLSQYEPKLVSQQYYESRSADLLSPPPTPSSTSTIDNIEDINHNKIIHRLNFELEERIRVLKQLTELQEKKKNEIQLNQSKQNYISSLPKIVSDLSKKLLTIQPILNSSYNQNIFHLPKPLYIIYSSVTSYQSSTKKSNLTLKIVGDIDKAIEFNIKSKNRDANSDDISDVPSIADDSDASASALAVPQYVVHPFSLVIEFQCDNQVTPLQFQYVVNSNMVSLGTTDAQDECFLSNIYCGSAIGCGGVELHPPVTAPSSGTTGSRTVKFYDWVQMLAGLINLNTSAVSTPNSQQLSNSGSQPGAGETTSNWTLVATILNSIEKRLQIKQKLKKQVDSVKKQQVTKNPNDHRFVMSVFEELKPTLLPANLLTTMLPNINQSTNCLAAFRIIYRNINVEITVHMLLSETLSYSKISSKLLKHSLDTNPNNLLLEKETMKSIESELNLFALSQANDVTFSEQLDKLKTILNYLCDPSTIRSKTLGRLRRGKMRLLPLHFDSASQLWTHK